MSGPPPSVVPGQPLRAADWNALIAAVAAALNIRVAAPLELARDGSGLSLSLRERIPPLRIGTVFAAPTQPGPRSSLVYTVDLVWPEAIRKLERSSQLPPVRDDEVEVWPARVGTPVLIFALRDANGEAVSWPVFFDESPAFEDCTPAAAAPDPQELARRVADLEARLAALTPGTAPGTTAPAPGAPA